jgi:hypothetical protein
MTGILTVKQPIFFKKTIHHQRTKMSPIHSQDSLIRDRIAQGWTAMLFCLMCNQINILQRDAVLNNFSDWAPETGMKGIYFLSGIFTIHIIMPLLVRSFDGAFFRKVAVVCAVILGLFPLVHQVVHAFMATRPLTWVYVFEFVHHGIALWVLVQSVKWMRSSASR